MWLLEKLKRRISKEKANFKDKTIILNCLLTKLCYIYYSLLHIILIAKLIISTESTYLNHTTVVLWWDYYYTTLQLILCFSF